MRNNPKKGKILSKIKKKFFAPFLPTYPIFFAFVDFDFFFFCIELSISHFRCLWLKRGYRFLVLY